MKKTIIQLTGHIIALILLVVLSSVDADCASPAEREALIALYDSTDGIHWKNSSGWLGEPGTECSWYGVECQDSKVVELYLDGNQLTGTLPPEIGNLINLYLLTLTQNQLTGPIPSEIGNLTNLQYLELGWNQLTGPIPPQIDQLTNLEGLDLNTNKFTGPIPTELSTLTGLQFLHLGSNQLTGTIPSSFSNLSNLQYFYFGDNCLTGGFSAVSHVQVEVHGNTTQRPIGDINHDRVLNIMDVINTLRVNTENPPELIDFCGDANLNGQIGTEDALNSLQIISGLKSIPICGDGIVESEEECDDGNLDDEDGCTSDCTIIYRKIFLTSSTHTGALGGLTGADTLCNQLATNAQLPGTYKAWLSDDSSSPSDRFTQHGHFVLIDGTTIANSWSDLTDATIVNPINLDENGNTVSSNELVWSNTDWNSSLYEFASSCLNWTSDSTEERGSGGYILLSDYRWSRGGVTALCSNPQHLYCFEQ